MCVLSGNGCRWEMQKREGGDCVSACVWMCHWWLWALCVARVHLLVCVSKSGCGWKRWCDYKWEKQKPGREDEVKEKEILSFTRRRTDIIQADGQNNRTTSCWTVNTNLVKLPEVKTLGPFNKAAVFLLPVMQISCYESYGECWWPLSLFANSLSSCVWHVVLYVVMICDTFPFATKLCCVYRTDTEAILGATLWYFVPL